MNWYDIVKLERRGKKRRNFRKNPDKKNPKHRKNPSGLPYRYASYLKDPLTDKESVEYGKRKDLVNQPKIQPTIGDIVINRPKVKFTWDSNYATNVGIKGGFRNQMQATGKCNNALESIMDKLLLLDKEDFETHGLFETNIVETLSDSSPDDGISLPSYNDGSDEEDDSVSVQLLIPILEYGILGMNETIACEMEKQFKSLSEGVRTNKKVSNSMHLDDELNVIPPKELDPDLSLPERHRAKGIGHPSKREKMEDAAIHNPPPFKATPFSSRRERTRTSEERMEDEAHIQGPKWKTIIRDSQKIGPVVKSHYKKFTLKHATKHVIYLTIEENVKQTQENPYYHNPRRSLTSGVYEFSIVIQIPKAVSLSQQGREFLASKLEA